MGLSSKRNSSPFMGKYPAEPGDGADLETQLFPIHGEVPGGAGGWGFLRVRSMEADP